MPKQDKANLETGVKKVAAKEPAAPTIELFGHVILVEGYALPTFTGCHALIALRDTPGRIIAVLTSQPRLQSLLETGLATGNLVDVYARRLTSPPSPRGGTWGVDVYHIDGVILYNTP
jgi:hypothetical protein